MRFWGVPLKKLIQNFIFQFYIAGGNAAGKRTSYAYQKIALIFETYNSNSQCIFRAFLKKNLVLNFIFQFSFCIAGRNAAGKGTNYAYQGVETLNGFRICNFEFKFSIHF